MSLKISVLTPSYNSVNFLDRAIQSVLAQDYTNWEHVIMDADSQDGTKNILAKYPHLIWESAPDKGQSDAMNKAFAKCTGDIIVYLNADDYFEPNVFGTVINEFLNKPETEMVVGNVLYSYEQTNTTTLHSPSIEFDSVVSFYHFRFPANPVGYFYKREVQNKIGPFPVGNHFTMDYWFLLRAMSGINIVKIECTLGVFVVSGDNKSSDAERSLMGASINLLEYIEGLIDPEEKKKTFRLLLNDAAKTANQLQETKSQNVNLQDYIVQLENEVRKANGFIYELNVQIKEFDMRNQELGLRNQELEQRSQQLELRNQEFEIELSSVYNSRTFRTLAFFKKIFNK